MAKMRAMVVRERGGRLAAEEREIPIPGPEKMRIRVQACGVCHSDVVTVQGLFPIVQYPRIPGHEVIGVVDAIGEGVHGWKVGDRAGVGWFGGSCGYCRRCRRDDAFACENVHEISGVTRDGGYASVRRLRGDYARRSTPWASTRSCRPRTSMRSHFPTIQPSPTVISRSRSPETTNLQLTVLQYSQRRAPTFIASPKKPRRRAALRKKVERPMSSSSALMGGSNPGGLPLHGPRIASTHFPVAGRPVPIGSAVRLLRPSNFRFAPRPT